MGRRKNSAIRADGRYQKYYNGRHYYGYSQAEVDKKVEMAKRDYEEGLKSSARAQTVRSYASQWLPVHKASVSEKCYADYARQINALIDVIGDMPVRDVTPSDIKRVYSEHYLNYSASTIHRSAMLYTSIFDSAVADGVCRVNPCRSEQSKPHKGTTGTHRAITEEEKELVLSVEHRFRAAALIMLYAGLRRGEVIALDIDRDVDFDGGWITVREAVRYNGNAPILSTPKTAAGLRTVPLLPVLRDALEGLHGLVISPSKGLRAGYYCSGISFKRSYESWLHALSEKAGREVRIRCHDLRHTYCVMLRDAGVEMKLAMQWMGHADEKMILRIYDHVGTTRIKNAVNLLEKHTELSQKLSQTESDPPKPQ